MKSRRNLAVLSVILFSILLIVLSVETYAAMPGTVCRMKENAIVGIGSEQNHDEVQKLIMAGDKDGLIQMFFAGRAGALSKGDKVLVLQNGFTHEVRVQSGQYRGEKAWVPAHLLNCR